MPQIKLSKRNVDGLTPGTERYTAWDTEVSGFGLRVTPGNERIYILKYRASGRQRWFTIGRHGSPWTPELARKEAIRLLGDIVRGVDPAEKRSVDREAITFASLCDIYLQEGVAHKKASTLRSDRGRIALHLKPLLGAKRADAITRADIERLLNDVKNGKTAAPTSKRNRSGSVAQGCPGVAAQCVALASTVLQFAADRHLRTDNPARGVKKPPVRKMQRFLSDTELAAVAESLDREVEVHGTVHAVAAIRVLALTGCRRSEIMGLRWSNVDLDRQLLHLTDSKTREKIVYLSPPAAAILRNLPRVGDNPHVVAGTLAGKPFIGIDKVWTRVREHAGLSEVRLHDLRHTFASVAAGASFGLPIIGKLLGHTQAQTTLRYSHFASDPLRQAADAIGASIAAAMEGKGAKKHADQTNGGAQ